MISLASKFHFASRNSASLPREILVYSVSFKPMINTGRYKITEIKSATAVIREASSSFFLSPSISLSSFSFLFFFFLSPFLFSSLPRINKRRCVRNEARTIHLCRLEGSSNIRNRDVD